MQKPFIVTLVAFFSFLFIVPVFVSAQTTTTTPSVQFRVEVGSLVCKNASGAASVLFVTEPKNGGYFEIIGGKIDQNGMTLDRRISLKSGTYTWKGVANQGYHEAPPSLGEFTIPVCSTSSSPVSSAPLSKKEPSQSITPTTESGKIVEKGESIVSDAATTAASSGTKENSPTETNQSGTFKIIIFGLIILGIGIAVFGLKKPTKK